MSKIAVATSVEGIAEHFGHCDHFDIFETSDTSVIGKTSVKNPSEHQRGYLPKFLYDQGVEVVIAGSLGSMAQQILDALNMKAIFGVSGTSDELVQKYLEGTLVSNPEGNGHHDHHEHHHHDHDHDKDGHHHEDGHGNGNCHHCH